MTVSDKRRRFVKNCHTLPRSFPDPAVSISVFVVVSPPLFLPRYHSPKIVMQFGVDNVEFIIAPWCPFRPVAWCPFNVGCKVHVWPTLMLHGVVPRQGEGEAVPTPASAEKTQAQAVPTSHVNEIVAGKVSKALQAAVAEEEEEVEAEEAEKVIVEAEAEAEEEEEEEEKEEVAAPPLTVSLTLSPG